MIIFVFVAGFGGIAAQTILLRELLILFSGNELSIGVIIGSWVIWAVSYTHLTLPTNREV